MPFDLKKYRLISTIISALNHDVFEDGGVRLYEIFKLMKLGMSFTLKK